MALGMHVLSTAVHATTGPRPRCCRENHCCRSRQRAWLQDASWHRLPDTLEEQEFKSEALDKAFACVRARGRAVTFEAGPVLRESRGAVIVVGVPGTQVLDCMA